MAQAQDYDTGGTGLDRLSRLFTDLNITHPMPVRRAQELMAWVRPGEYDRIVGGEYVRRGEEPPARNEAGDAAAHYADRFRNAFRDAGEAVGSATEQLAELAARSAPRARQEWSAGVATRRVFGRRVTARRIRERRVAALLRLRGSLRAARRRSMNFTQAR